MQNKRNARTSYNMTLRFQRKKDGTIKIASLSLKMQKRKQTLAIYAQAPFDRPTHRATEKYVCNDNFFYLSQSLEKTSTYLLFGSTETLN